MNSTCQHETVLFLFICAYPYSFLFIVSFPLRHGSKRFSVIPAHFHTARQCNDCKPFAKKVTLDHIWPGSPRTQAAIVPSSA